jgi:hypothetical protein
MWKLALGVVLSFLPRRWRCALASNEEVPWVHATVLSALIQGLLAFDALVAWYSHSVTTWAANAMDSALRNGPERTVPGQAIGFSALVLWMIHPVTWFIAFFVFEGLVRLLAAAITDQIFPTLPLAFADWCIGKVTGRAPEGDAQHMPSMREALQSIISIAKDRVTAAGFPEVADELTEHTEDGEVILEIHSSRRKAEWTPPKTVRIGESYFRLEHWTEGQAPRRFIYRLRRVAAGAPGRTVIVYESPREI